MIHKSYAPPVLKGTVTLQVTSIIVKGQAVESWQDDVFNKTHLALIEELGGRVAEALVTTRAGVVQFMRNEPGRSR